MLNRRTFMTGIAAAALVRPALSLDKPASAPDGDSAIREILKNRVDVEKRSVGMAVSVVTPDQQRFVVWGRARSDDDQPVSPDTVFEIGSITKIFTAFVLADMVRTGEVKLDDPVSSHLPDFKIPLNDGRPITLADLATHTSGLPRWPLPPSNKPPSAAAIEAMSRFTVEDLKAWLKDYHPESHPPSAGGWWYSNLGFTLLGLALAHRSGQTYEALLQARVIGPIGLRDTAYSPTPSMRSRLAQGHDQSLKPLAHVDIGIFIGSGGLLSTPRDLSRFAAALLSSSNRPIEQDQQLLLSVQRPAPWIGGVQALGWEILGAPSSYLSKDGVTDTQAASIVLDSEKREAIVAFSNTFPDISKSTLSGGGVGTADIARHLLRPQIPLGGQGGTSY